MRIFLLFLLFQSFLSFAEESISIKELLKNNEPPYELWKYQLDNINYSDGIDYREADTIIQNFAFTKKAAGCGATGAIVDYGVYWKVATYVGFSAKKGRPIFIYKKNGRISQDGEVLFSHPSKMEMIYPKSFDLEKLVE
jgi:hypothetical protein